MAKGDFNLNEQDYDVVYDENEKKRLFSKNKSKSNKKDSNSNIDNIMINNALSDNQNSNTNSKDFPSINQDNPFNSSSVVYEEKANMTWQEKLKECISTINTTALIAIGGFVLAILIIILVIVLTISKENNSYKADVIIPDIVYMGETSEISVNSKYTGKRVPKKKVSDTITKFNIEDKKVLSVVEEETKGSEVLNPLIPVQEGRSNVTVVSKLNNKTIANVKKEVVVCPTFDTDLLMSKQISVLSGGSYNLKIDFGEEECSQGITYTSSNDEVATIDESGLIKGLQKGQAIITMSKGTKSVSFKVDVTGEYIGIKSFEVIPKILQLSEGEKHRLKINYNPVNATSFNTNFYSDNTSIAKVSSGGLVEAISEGTATIKAYPSTSSMAAEVKVVVTKGEQKGTFATDMTLNKNEITLVQGKSEKIIATLTPENISNKVISWKTSDGSIASVDQNGVIYAKNAGTAEITATTKNNIVKTVKVTVLKMKSPSIKASDSISSGTWHTKPYVITFATEETGITYYYGIDENKMDSTGEKVIINKDQNNTYYVKSCTRTCRETCTDKKDKNGKIVRDEKGQSVKVCKSTCSKKPSICSDVTSYIAKLDTTKPQVVTVAGIEHTPVKEDTIQIAIKDSTSLVQKWCVTNKNNASSCKWNTIQTSTNPVVDYTATKNGAYFAFAKDTAGNISDGLKFEITNIE